jgi:putative peptidoglycan lipid II flippase
MYADVFRAGIRMPNVLQNLLGEGTLSASFIPVYSELLEQGKEKEAGRVAGAIFSLLVAGAGLLSLGGVLLAPVLVSLFVPGFEGEKRALAIDVVRIVFPMTATLVLAAWALGILNSHRKFFVSYVAPVVWNAAMIATMFLFGNRMSLSRLVIALSWGALLGGVLQFAVQLPWVLRLERNIKLSFDHRFKPVREALRNAGPAIMGRGVVQISGYIDTFLASLLATGAVSAIGYAQTLYILPVSLFGMSVAAAELPELSRKRTSSMDELRLRTNSGLERIAFFVVPSFVAFAALGDVLVASLYQTGEFGRDDTLLVYFTLAAFSLGLLASSSTRLFSSTFFALRDTKTPAKVAMTRVLLAAVLSFFLMLQFEPIPSLRLPGGLFAGLQIGDRRLGGVGLALGSGIAAWIEWILLRRRLRALVGPLGASPAKLGKMFAAALAGAAAGWAVRLALESVHRLLLGFLVFAAYGVVYFAVAAALGLSEAQLVRSRLTRLVRPVK